MSGKTPPQVIRRRKTLDVPAPIACTVCGGKHETYEGMVECFRVNHPWKRAFGLGTKIK